jgi:hypothetical protein
VGTLLVSQMYPGAADPDLGVFVRQIEQALQARGHELQPSVLDRHAGWTLRYRAPAAVRAIPRKVDGTCQCANRAIVAAPPLDVA